MITYKNEWSEQVVVYAEKLDYGIRITFAKKHRSETNLIPKDKEEEFLDLINKEKE